LKKEDNIWTTHSNDAKDALQVKQATFAGWHDEIDAKKRKVKAARDRLISNAKTAIEKVNRQLYRDCKRKLSIEQYSEEYHRILERQDLQCTTFCQRPVK
jgi:hypothetical protein